MSYISGHIQQLLFTLPPTENAEVLDLQDKQQAVIFNMCENSTKDCRDGLLRGELEACLMFTPPSELLVAQPISSPSQKLLGSYVTQSRGLRSQSVPKSKFSQGGGLAAVTEFYSTSGLSFTYTVQTAVKSLSHLA